MSHVKKILVLKEALDKVGVKSPVEQQKIINEAFISAIIVGIHTACNGHFCPDAESKMILALDMWNEVSPIPGQVILNEAKTRLSEVKLSLLTKGRVEKTKEFVAKDVEGGDVTLEAVKEEYYGLLQDLAQEFRNGEE